MKYIIILLTSLFLVSNASAVEEWKTLKDVCKYYAGTVVVRQNAILQAFINEGLWDEARVFSSEIYLKKGVKKPQLRGKPTKESFIDSDCLKIILND